MPRLTYKYMIKWLQAEFDRLEIEWEPYEMYRQKLPPHAFEGGAAPYIILIRNKKSHSDWTTVRVEDWINHLQEYIDSGKWALHWKPNNRFSITDSSITIKKV